MDADVIEEEVSTTKVDSDVQVEDLETLKQNLNAKGYVNLVMNQRRTPSQYGQTHSLTIDTWQPQGGGQPAPQQQAPQQYAQQPAAQPFNAAPAQDLQESAPPMSAPPAFDDTEDMDDVPF